EIDNGAGVPLKLRAGQTFYLNQLDLRASISANVDEGVAGLDASGDFADLVWSGIQLRDAEPVLSPNPDGTFIRRRFYRNAECMEQDSKFEITQVDADGVATAPPLQIDAGNDNKRRASDTFFIRRLRAIQWAYDCASLTDCSSAQSFQEEALVELR